MMSWNPSLPMNGPRNCKCKGVKILELNNRQKNIKEALQEAASFLRDRGIGEGRVEAELLLALLLQVGRPYLYAHGETVLSADRLADYAALCRRRAAGEPLAYISGEKEFMGLPFYVESGVFIPRPETECLVELVLRWARKEKNYAAETANPDILELGAGSGNIAISLAYYLPRAFLVAIEADTKALAVARRNIRRHGMAERINLLQGHYYRALDAAAGVKRRFGIIVANPPYIEESILPGLPAEVRQEPRRALCGGPDGLDAYREIIAGALEYLLVPGLLALELGAGQAEPVKALACRAGFAATAVHKDYAGTERVMLCFT